MGQAKVRGTKEQRVNAALEARAELEREREELALQIERARAVRWAAMSPEQREAALNKAKRQAESYGYMRDIFGHDAAMVLASLDK